MPSEPLPWTDLLAQWGDSLKQAREDVGLSGIQLAAEVGVSHQAIYAYENGRYTPSDYTKIRIAHALDKDVRDIWFTPERVA